jgi:predicted aconitase
VCGLSPGGLVEVQFVGRFLGAFTKLRKATLSFVIFVCLSVRPVGRMEQLGRHRTDFRKILYYFPKICRENSSFVTIRQD